MAKPRRNRPSAWLLRPDDLPPDWMVKRDPALAGLADNAIFRLITFHRHASRASFTLGRGLLYFFLILFLLYTFSCLALLILPFVLRRRHIFGSPQRIFSRSIGIPEAFVPDLLHIGADPRDLAVALYGQSCRSSPWVASQAILTLVVLVFFFTGVLFAGIAPELPVLSLACYLFFGIALTSLTNSAYVPHSRLPAALREAASLRRWLAWKRNPWRAFLLFFLLLIGIFFLLVAARLLGVLIFSLLDRLDALADPAHPFRRARDVFLYSPWIAPAVAFFGGIGLGVLRGRHCARHPDRYLRRIEDNLAKSLDILDAAANNRREKQTKSSAARRDTNAQADTQPAPADPRKTQPAPADPAEPNLSPGPVARPD